MISRKVRYVEATPFGREVYNMKTAMKKSYTAPTLKVWGKVSDLTRTGKTRDGDDAKGGSVTHSEGQ